MSIKVKYKNTINTMNTIKKIELNCNFTKIWKKIKLTFTKKCYIYFQQLQNYSKVTSKIKIFSNLV